MKKLKNLYAENYKMLKEAEDPKKWKDILSWIGRINILKISILRKANLNSNSVQPLSKSPKSTLSFLLLICLLSVKFKDPQTLNLNEKRESFSFQYY